MKAPNPPKNLSRSAKSIWKDIVSEYELEDAAAQLLLGVALEARDRLVQAQDIIARDGLIVQTPNGPRNNPALTAEKDARNGMLASLKALNLDLEPLRDRLGRPGGEGITPQRRTHLRAV